MQPPAQTLPVGVAAVYFLQMHPLQAVAAEGGVGAGPVYDGNIHFPMRRTYRRSCHAMPSEAVGTALASPFKVRRRFCAFRFCAANENRWHGDCMQWLGKQIHLSAVTLPVNSVQGMRTVGLLG